MTPRRRHMGKSVARGSKKTLVDQCYDDLETRNYLMKKIGWIIMKEIKTMCSARVQSILCSESKDVLKNFKWDDLMTELCTYAPLLNKILHFCTKTSKIKRNRDATIGTCAAILFKFRLSRMNLIQKIISLILHAGHCGKQVSVCALSVHCLFVVYTCDFIAHSFFKNFLSLSLSRYMRGCKN